MSIKIYKKKTVEPDSAYVLDSTADEEITNKIISSLQAQTEYTFKLVRSLPGYRDSLPRFISATTLAGEQTGNAAPSVTLTIDDNSVTPSDQVILTANPSDSDGTISKVEFYMDTLLIGEVASAPYICIINEMAEGSYTFTAKAFDNENASTVSNTVSLTVASTANGAPVAYAGADNTITLPTNSVTLQGSGIDQDGTISSYLWEKVIGPAATITTPNAASTTVTGMEEGSYEFRLTVTDNAGATHQDTVQIVVNPAATVPAPAAPTSFVTNSYAKTFDWTFNPQFADISFYEYTTTGGVVVDTVTTKPQTIPNNDFAPGTVGVRVKADGDRPASAWLYNTVAFTYNPNVKANVVFVGNSIVAGGGEQGAPFPSVADTLLPSDYVVTNKGISGQTIQQMQANIQTQLLDLKNPNATHNIAVILEGTNALGSAEMTSGMYYDTWLKNYCTQARSAGWKIVNITIPPVTSPTYDPNPRAKTINAALASNTGGFSDRVVNLAEHIEAGAFGGAANGNDPGYSSYHANLYYDGVHPTEYVHDIIGHMVRDVLVNLVDGASIPDPTIYPVSSAASPITWANVVLATVDPATNIITTNQTSSDYTSGATSKQAIGYTGTPGLQGIIEWMHINRDGGGFLAGPSDTNPNVSFQSIRHAFFAGATLSVFELGSNKGVVGSWNRLTKFKIEVYDNSVKFYANNLLVYTSNNAPVFPAFFDVSFARNGGIRNAKMFGNNIINVF